ncbi:MAG: NUDIX hydrolase [Candidatus Omnitrophota bacterium]|jgi:ADP-ribose pyrophosphatase YjhB (NUDIX family)|nr:MAG: NUDIX hydrolase [Candidatus Omnitrophota bacterium]
MTNQKIRNRVAVVIVENENILLVQHEKYGRTYWLIPGGGVEFGETLIEAGKRELKEEAGLEIEVGQFLFISESIPPDHHRHVINYFFEGKIIGGELKVGRDNVLRDVQWLPIREIPNLEMYPNTKRELLDFIQSGQVGNRSLGNIWS